MIDRRAIWTLPLALALSLVAAWGLSRVFGGRDAISVEGPGPVRHGPPLARPGAPSPALGELRWIVAGGGASPELGQVQIEQDLALAERALGESGRGLLLFSGGPGSNAVQVAVAGAAPEASLRATLGELLAPHAGRDAVYRSTELHPEGAATAEAILSAIEGAAMDGDAPLTVFLAGHGLGGEEPRESRFLTWGAHDLWVEDLATVLDELPGHRPVRFVITSCYAGGFAELAFRGADPEQGVTDTDRCGFFATTWDRAAAGCDPNPDRGAHEGYGIHFLHALRGEGRDGAPLDRREIDFDGDGAISLLEAHTRARIASSSLDVPVTTSERLLRAVVDEDEIDPRVQSAAPLIEERAVVDALSARLELLDPDDAHARLGELHAQMQELAERLDGLDEEVATLEEDLSAALLHRWPTLEDPWRDDFEATLASEGDEIRRFLEESALGAQRDERREERDEIASEHDALLIEAAPLERLVRAILTLALAARLQAEGGNYWLRYQALLACERGWP